MNEAGQERFKSLLAAAVQVFAAVSQRQLEQLWRHFSLLRQWNRAISLTTVDSLEDAVVRHYGESLFLGAHLPAGELRIADVGSGPGFPGFPVAVLRPDCQVCLIESVGKKAAFLREAAALPNISVLAVRAESLREKYDWVVSRAVRPQDVVKTAERSQARCALLVGRADANRLPGVEIIELPWGENRVLALSATVPRGT